MSTMPDDDDDSPLPQADGLRYSHPGLVTYVAERVAHMRGNTVQEVMVANRCNVKEIYGV